MFSYSVSHENMGNCIHTLAGSQDNTVDIPSGHRADCLGFLSQQGLEIFCSQKPSRLPLGPTQFPIWWTLFFSLLFSTLSLFCFSLSLFSFLSLCLFFSFFLSLSLCLFFLFFFLCLFFYFSSPQGSSRWCMMAITHCHPVPRIRMYGVIPLFPLYAFMACSWTTVP